MTATYAPAEVIGWLESGDYTQGRQRLITRVKSDPKASSAINHCCLGVMCDKIGVPIREMSGIGAPHDLGGTWFQRFNEAFPWCPELVADKLADANDSYQAPGSPPYAGPIARLHTIQSEQA